MSVGPCAKSVSGGFEMVTTSLHPVRVSDRLSLGRLFDRACARGYDVMCKFIDAMESKGVSHLTLLDCIADYREWSDGEKFCRIMNDDQQYDENSRGMNIRIYQDDGTVVVQECSVPEIEDRKTCQTNLYQSTSRRS